MLSVYRAPAEGPLHLFAFPVLGSFWPGIAFGTEVGQSLSAGRRPGAPRGDVADILGPSWACVSRSPCARTEDPALTPLQVQGALGL